MGNYKNLNDYEIMYMISENNDDATNLLFTKYKPLIISMAKEYYSKGKRYGLELDDFIQEGYYGLFCAIRQYNTDKNNLFYTYLLVCIRSKMNNLIIKNSSNRQMVLNNSISIYDSAGDNDLSLIDVISDKKATIPDIRVEEFELESSIKKVLYSLDFDDSIVCELKLNGFTSKDISSLLGISLKCVYNSVLLLKKNLSILIEKNNL